MEMREAQHIDRLKCTHCDEQIGDLIPIINGDHTFCCHGCETVYSILKDNDLQSFYKIKDQEGARLSPVKENRDSYQYMDSEEFLNKSALHRNQNLIQIKFHLADISCMACLWLIEKTPEFVKGLNSCRLNLENNVAEIEVDLSKTKLSQIAQAFSNLGHRPNVINSKQTEEELQKKADRSDILRIGIAGAALGNIMLFAISNYAGADGNYKTLFNWISALISLPVMLYCALPFYKNSLTSIKMKSISIDIPLSLAIVIAYAISIYNQFIGSDHIYYDSISSLVFLILLSRYFLKISLRKTVTEDNQSSFFKVVGITKVNNDNKVEVLSNEIKKDDEIIINDKSQIQFDGILLSDRAIINNSILTGESKPLSLRRGDLIHAGSFNMGKSFKMKVVKTDEETTLGKLLQKLKVTHASRGHIVSLTDKIAKYFTYLVIFMMISSFTYYYFTTNFHHALEIALAVTIVACPCALALATPLSFLKSLKLLKDREIFVKNERSLEKVSEINNIILDKTGTLTNGDFGIVHEEHYHDINIKKIRSLILLLEGPSDHPIAISFKESLSKYQHDHLEMKDHMQITGEGVSAEIEGDIYFLGKAKNGNRLKEYPDFTQVGLYQKQDDGNHLLLALYVLGDKIKDGSKNLVNHLSRYSEIHLATGDAKTVALSVGKNVGIKQDNIHSELSPEDKNLIVTKLSNTMMIGDGANDSLALRNADVGVCIGGSVDLALEVSDIYLSTYDISKVWDLFVISHETIKLIKRNLLFSILYNITGITLAMMGLISPLVAAIFMPISSFTVLVSTIVGTRKLRSLKGQGRQ